MYPIASQAGIVGCPIGELAGNVLDLWLGNNGGSCVLALIWDGA